MGVCLVLWLTFSNDNIQNITFTYDTFPIKGQNVMIEWSQK